MPIHVMPPYVVSAIPEPEELTSLPLNLDLGLLVSIKLFFCLHLLQDLRLEEYTIVITDKQQMGYSVANAPRHVFTPPSVKDSLTPKYKQQGLSNLRQRESPFPGSYQGIADMLQIPIFTQHSAICLYTRTLSICHLAASDFTDQKAIRINATNPDKGCCQRRLHSAFPAQKM